MQIAKKQLNILVTGNYDSDYNRTKILLSGLEACENINLLLFPFQKKNKFSRKKIQELSKKADFVYLPPFTHAYVRFVKRNSECPVFFDPLISKYQTKVFDYKQVSRFSPRALKNYLKDKIALAAADFIFADTLEHKKYFINTFNLSTEKIGVLPIGVMIKDFFKLEKPDNKKFIVGFYGGFIPLQGTTHIIETANLLKNRKDIQFQLIGTGFEYEKIKSLIKKYKLENIDLKGWIDYKELNSEINKFDVCLGIFGKTQKAELVIPNKIFHYAASAKAIITKSTPAIKEIFTNLENIILTDSEPQNMADKIIELKENKQKRIDLARKAQNLIYENYSEEKIAEIFIKFTTKKIK